MKMTKKILSVLLVLGTIVGGLAACDPAQGTENTTTTVAPEPTTTAPPHKETYTFQVLFPDETPAANVSLKLTQNGDACAEIKTDLLGNATCEIEPGFYRVEIVQDSIPSGYAFETSIRTSDTAYDYTLLLTQKCNHKYDNYVCKSCGKAQLYSAFNPEQMYIGETGTMHLDKKRKDDAEGVEEGSSEYYTCTRHDDSMFYFSVSPYLPEHVGHYKITVSGVPEGVTLFLGHFSSTAASVSPRADIKDEGNAPSIEFNMQEKYLQDSTGAWTYSNSWLFGVRVVGDADYPLDIRVTVTRERDLIAGQDYAITDRFTVEMEKDAKNAADVLGDVSGKTLIPIQIQYEEGDYPKAAEITPVLCSDGYYHIGDETGPILLVDLCNGNPILGGDASFITVNAASGTENLALSYQIEPMHNEIYYYSSMLKEYGALCNEDGVYPINEQLYHFLTEWTKQRGNKYIIGELDDEHGFLIACSYYL